MNIQVRSFVTPASIMILVTGLAGCSAGDENGEVTTTEVFATGDILPGIDPGDFAEARDAFNANEGLSDGLGPIFNERGCGNCHTLGAQGGAGEQIERRFGRFVNGRFDDLSNRGGSLRQLFTNARFDRPDGTACQVPLEREPAEATVKNVGRLTTPLFGLGLVDAMPDSFFDGLAAAQPQEQRGIANRVQIVLPNPDDPAQNLGMTRVGRFGWKAGVPTLTQFAADAYVNEMGITTESCFRGIEVVAFATESAPNGVPMEAGCDDLAAPLEEGLPEGCDEGPGECGDDQTEMQEDVEEFATFMTFLAPPSRLPLTQDGIAGQPLFTSVGCATCHVTNTFRTPANPPTGVPGNFAFQPFSDFLVHDMGSLGDQIGNPGDTLEVTRRMRTAPLWGIHHRNKLLHDGRTTDITTAIINHDGQAARARDAFRSLSGTQQHQLTEFVRSL